MSVFADSSALVPLYVTEDGRDVVDAFEDVTVSDLAAVEVLSAVWSRQRGGEISPHHAAFVAEWFEVDFYGSAVEPPRFTRVQLTRALLRDAAALVEPHALAAGDAIQLACAVAARRADPDADTFACFDQRLRAAAAAEGFAVVP